MSDDLFTLANVDPAGEAKQEATSRVRQALAPQFAFCAQAETHEEFEDRLTLVANRVDNAVEVATKADQTLFPIVHRAVIESWNNDFEGVLKVRAIEAQAIAAQAAADELIVWPDVKRKKVDKDGNVIETMPDDELIDWGDVKRPKHAMRKGAPFAGYSDFAQCERENADKDDPAAYSATIMRKVEDGKTGSAKTAAEKCSGSGQTGTRSGSDPSSYVDCPVCGSSFWYEAADGLTVPEHEAPATSKTADWRVVNDNTGYIDKTPHETKPEAEQQNFGEGFSVQYVNPMEAENQEGDVEEEVHHDGPAPPKSATSAMHRISMTAAEADAAISRAPAEFQARLAALKPYLAYGPGYNRLVAENFHDAIRFLGSQNTYAEIYLAKAESHATYQETGTWVSPWDGQAQLNVRGSWHPQSFDGMDTWTKDVGGHLATVVRTGGRFQWSTATYDCEYEGEEPTLEEAQQQAVASLTSLGGTPPWLKDKKDGDKSDEPDGDEKPASDTADDAVPEGEDGSLDGDVPGDPTDPEAGPPPAPEQNAPSLDPTVMDVGQTSSMNYTLADGSTGSIEVTFVREENGVYFFNGPTGEFGVGNSNDSWTDSDNNTFSFSGASPTKQSPDTTNVSETPVDKVAEPVPPAPADKPSFPPKKKDDDKEKAKS